MRGRSFGRQATSTSFNTWLTMAAEFDRRRDFLIDEVHRHFHVQLLVGVNALEVDVLDQLFERVILHRAATPDSWRCRASWSGSSCGSLPS